MQLYRLITGPDDSSFCHRITDALNKGWQLSGDASVTTKPDGSVICAQAITKVVDGIDYDPEMKLSDY